MKNQNNFTFYLGIPPLHESILKAWTVRPSLVKQFTKLGKKVVKEKRDGPWDWLGLDFSAHEFELE